MKNLILIFAILFLNACAISITLKSPLDEAHFETKVFVDAQNRIVYDGPLAAEAINEVFTLYEKSTRKPTVVVINSFGGDVDLGVELGLWLHTHKLDILVEKSCMSSCANYVFTAARNKYLNKDSILMWHGSSYQKGWDNEVKQGVQWAVDMRKQDDSFFSTVGVDPRITVYGFGSVGLWERVKGFFQAEPIYGFDYSISDLNRMGVNNIYLNEKEWNWRKYYSLNLVRAKLNEDYLLKL